MQSLEERVEFLERKLKHTRLAACAAAVVVVAVAAGGRGDLPRDDVVPAVRARRIELIDDAGVVRVSLDQDAKDTQRRSRSCGLHIYDRTGAERGGMSTFDDLSVVLAMDAPRGVGASMPDRIGLQVDPDGSASVGLIDNKTMVPVRFASDAEGGGGLEFIGYDFAKKVATVMRTSFAGETRHELPFGDGK